MCKLLLSSSGLKNILQNSCDYFSQENEFRFIFGEHEVKMKNIFAEFISPVVSRLRQSDPTINSLNLHDIILNIQKKIIENNYNFGELLDLKSESIFSEEIISLFKQLSNGYEVEINEEQSVQMKFLSIFIGNEDMYSKIDQLFPQEINKSNYEIYLQTFPYFEFLSKTISYSNFLEYSTIIDFISSNFYSIDRTSLLKYPKKVLLSIISNKNLQLESEDSLFDFINEIYSNEYSEFSVNEEPENNINIINFYEQVDISALSDQKFQDFLEQMNPYNINSTIWQKICQYFAENKTNKKRINSKRKKNDQLCFEYDGNINNSFKGIIHHFTDECGGNVDDNSIINISASSAIVGYSAKFAADVDDDQHYFSSLSRENSWLMFDFRDKRVKPTHYSIRSRHDVGRGQGHPKCWVIEGSNSANNDNWILLDSRNGIDDLDDANSIKTFDIQSHTNEEFEFLRIRQISENSQGSYNLAISAIEFFGSVNYSL